MKLFGSSKTLSMAASVLMLGAVSIMTVNAADQGQQLDGDHDDLDDGDRQQQAGWRPNWREVMLAIPDTYCAGWVTGVSRDLGTRGHSIKLGDVPNDRANPTYCSAYYSFPNWWHQKLSDVRRIRASFLTPVGTINYAGSPRFCLEVQNAAPNNTLSGDKIYLDPALFSGTAVGVWRDCDFTGDKTACSIFDSRGVQYKSDGIRSAWSKLVSDPYYAGKRVGLLYLIQDASTGPNYVDRISLDSAFFTLNVLDFLGL